VCITFKHFKPELQALWIPMVGILPNEGLDSIFEIIGKYCKEYLFSASGDV
jgi:hypothetical protein